MSAVFLLLAVLVVEAKRSATSIALTSFAMAFSRCSSTPTPLRGSLYGWRSGFLIFLSSLASWSKAPHTLWRVARTVSEVLTAFSFSRATISSTSSLLRKCLQMREPHGLQVHRRVSRRLWFSCSTCSRRFLKSQLKPRLLGLGIEGFCGLLDNAYIHSKTK